MISGKQTKLVWNWAFEMEQSSRRIIIHLLNNPASNTNCDPVTKRDFSEARKTTALATSSGSTHGTASRLPALRSAISFGVDPSNAASPSFIGVFTPVG